MLNFQFLNWTLRFLSAISFDAFHFQGETSFLKPSKHIRSTTIDRVKDSQNNLEIFFQQQKIIASKANAWPGISARPNQKQSTHQCTWNFSTSGVLFSSPNRVVPLSTCLRRNEISPSLRLRCRHRWLLDSLEISQVKTRPTWLNIQNSSMADGFTTIQELTLQKFPRSPAQPIGVSEKRILTNLSLLRLLLPIPSMYVIFTFVHLP